MSIPQNGSYKYNLCIRQQPTQGRTSNLRDGRSIEPPPVLELIVTDSSGARIKDLSVIDYHKFVANVLIVIPKKMITAISLLDIMDGSKTVQCEKLYDPENMCYSLFFVFPDLFCRGRGQYLFKFSLFDIMECMMAREKRGHVCTVESSTFTIYSPNEYPGRLSLSKLSWSFFNQGVHIQPTKIKKNFYGVDFESLPCSSTPLANSEDVHLVDFSSEVIDTEEVSLSTSKVVSQVDTDSEIIDTKDFSPIGRKD